MIYFPGRIVERVKRSSIKYEEVAAPIHPFQNMLEERSEIAEVSGTDLVVRFYHNGDQRDEANILRGLVEHGFEVSSFGSEERSLEDVFMNVTKGIVQ